MKTKLITSYLISALGIFYLAYSNVSIANSQKNSVKVSKTLKINNIIIEQQPPIWTLSAGNAPLLQREAKLPFVELPLALIMQPLFEKKDYAGVLAAIEEARSPEYKPLPILTLSPALMIIKGQVYLSLNKNEEAKTSFLAAIAQLPDFIRAHKGLAAIYIRQEKYEEARKHIVKAITLGENDAELFGYLAYINMRSNSPWSAIAGYEQALLLEPENQQWQQGLLYSLISVKDNHAAKAMLNEMLQKTPNDARLWLQRSRLSLDDNASLDALTSMEMAIRLGNNRVDNIIATAQLHVNYGSVSRAAELIANLLTQWQELKPSDSNKSSKYFDGIESVIAWLIYEKHWPEAQRLLTHSEQYLTEISDLQKSQLKLHHAGLPGISSKKRAQFYEQAIKLAPTNGKALIALAEHYQNSNDYTHAQMLYIRAATLDDFAERAFIGHAQVYIEQKNYAQAVTMLRKASKLNPSRQDIVDNIRLLDRMINNQI